MQNTIVTADLWEAIYFLVSGARLSGIECIPLNGKLSCQITFFSERLPELQKDYYSGQGKVEIFSCRRAYFQIQSYIADAKRSYKKLQREKEGMV